MPFTVSEGKIRSKIKIGDRVAVMENIKYPVFESGDGTGEKGIEKINKFYLDVANKYSAHARIRLPRKIKASPKKHVLPLSVGMNCIVSFSGGNVACIVLDLSLGEGTKLRTRRFTQTWLVNSGQLLPACEIIKTDIKTRKKILSAVVKLAKENFENPAFGYYGNYLKRLVRSFHINNCHPVPGGIAFFVDGGVLRPEKYGPSSFVLPFSAFSDIINPDFAPNLAPKQPQNENIVNNV